MDPIADMLTIIRNALLVNKYDVAVPNAKMKWFILQNMQELRLIDSVKKNEETNMIEFSIVQEDGQPVFENLKRLSTPGRRLYVGWKEIPRPSKNGVVLVSTSQGVMTGMLARKRHLGGELICEIS
ncbi:MAG: 30S ribosomal protein S8 [Candidatus Kerfeldbacteria bacterium CG08_land_8_20_14_0_20_42_7]|uniref:Small ribosomal subunit protein uS8 n=1 Tax=Candidatus Kerfeldbacteria bacterium CG08_land_8_20_14_0_20_42_7 TaxID=2014245 RepID=A0A2H0YT89_9BACT|nr:MAG: 30S ribosomal protein S8 [Candidatus Kerfeldbacteria bacterium CG08_land_8_20_14_0_20_42_7]